VLQRGEGKWGLTKDIGFGSVFIVRRETGQSELVSEEMMSKCKWVIFQCLKVKARKRQSQLVMSGFWGQWRPVFMLPIWGRGNSKEE
jgi:hypothetical protein